MRSEADCILSIALQKPPGLKHRNSSAVWSLASMQWLRTLAAKTELAPPFTRARVLDALNNRRSAAPSAAATRWIQGLKCEDSWCVRKAEVENGCNYGFRAVYRVRVGTFPLTNNWVRNGRISPAWRDLCAFCGKQEKETAGHLLLECEAWNQQRSAVLGSQLTKVRLLSKAASHTKLALRGLLGGRLPVQHHNATDTVCATARFLTAIRAQRTEKTEYLIGCFNIE